MTDIRTLYKETEAATRLAGTLSDDADTLLDDLADVRVTISGSVELARDYADENPGLTRELDCMRESLEAFEKTITKFQALSKGLDKVLGDVADVEMALDDMQHDAAEREDLVMFALDVERGIRDPHELSRLVHDCAGLAL